MRYHEWILSQFRKERAMQMSLDLPSSDLELFGHTTCGQCTKMIPLSQAVVKTFYDDTSIQQQEHFCCEDCRDTWYIAMLNRKGL